MKFPTKLALISSALLLSACALTPEQKAAQEAKRLRAEQALQVKLARQCDTEAAQLLHQQFNPPLSQTEQQKQEFEQRYAEKIGQPMFQACYKLALENYKAQEELEYMRQRYYWDDYPRWGWHRFCYSCW